MRSAHARLTSEELARGPSAASPPHKQSKHLLEDSVILPLPTEFKKAFEAFRLSLEADPASLAIEDVQSSRELLSLLDQAVPATEPDLSKRLQWLDVSADRWARGFPALADDARNLLLSIRNFVTREERVKEPAVTPPARGDQVPKSAALVKPKISGRSDRDGKKGMLAFVDPDIAETFAEAARASGRSARQLMVKLIESAAEEYVAAPKRDVLDATVARFRRDLLDKVTK